MHSRLRGRQSKTVVHSMSQKLTCVEEESLLQKILLLDDLGFAPQASEVRAMADLLLKERGNTPAEKVGQKLAYNFVNRQEELVSRFSRRFDYKKAKAEDPEVIQDWFERVKETIVRYGIVDEDIYNFDETGLSMGITVSKRVICRKVNRGRPRRHQPGNRYMATVIECANAAGWTLPAYVILKGQSYMEAWFDEIPDDWHIKVSPKGWTSNEIGIQWLQNVFIPMTNRQTKGDYRLLVLDGHASHVSVGFNKICEKHKIVPFCMPSNSSHILQPLDVGPFGVLKTTYGERVQAMADAEIKQVDKLDFLQAYSDARKAAFKTESIKSAFAASGISPLNSERVISKLQSRPRTPSPRKRNVGDDEPKTPKNTVEVRKLEAETCGVVQTGAKSPVKLRLQKFARGLEINIHQRAFMQKETEKKLAVLDRQAKKKNASKRHRHSRTDLTRKQASELFSEPRKPKRARKYKTRDSNDEGSPTRKRTPRACGICRKPGHRRETCPKKDNQNHTT
ncbi:hypothetical protein OXX80_003745 [Metschnikowia pulcherrima]